MTEKQSSGEKPAKITAEKTQKRKMKPGGGKAKGNLFEGQVAKKLSSFLSPLTFIRTPGSGARVGGRNFEAFGKLFGEEALKIFVGDVVPTNEKESSCIFNYSVECKSYKTSDSFETLVQGNSNVFRWMQESITDAQKVDKFPLLIFKWNRTPIYVGILKKDLDLICKIEPKLVISQNGLSICIFHLDDLCSQKEFWIKYI